MAKQWNWYCDSTKGNLHAFCLLRSPYKTSIKKKVIELTEGHGFLQWSIGKIDDDTLKQMTEANFEFDTLYVKDGKVN